MTLIRRLEYVFSPPGLPLVAKQEGAVRTTSILVRGGPGTGKTTLAMALALTVARENAGRVLYLSTEIAPVDAKVKAVALGVAEARIGPWTGARDDDEVLVDHLAVGATTEIDSPEDRLTGSIERLWSRLAEPSPPGAPLRAVVVDAFALVGLEAPKEMRARVMDLIVALEERGISPIFVEEAPAPAQDWIGYLVDLQFETSWGRAPDTGELQRQLTCAKSRYVEARPGPHDYGREDGALQLWPALAPIVASGYLERLSSPEFLWPPQLRISSGSLFGDTGRPYYCEALIERAEWLQPLRLSMGRHGGIHRASWRTIDLAKHATSVVLVDGMGAAAKRGPTFYANAADDVAALAALGLTQVVHMAPSEDDQVGLSFGTRTGEFYGGEVIEWTPDPIAAVADLYLVALNERSFVDGACEAMMAVSVDRRTVLLYAGVNAYHLRSAVAADWLLTQFDAELGELARALSIPALVRLGRIDEALTALSGLPQEVRDQWAGEIERRRT